MLNWVKHAFVAEFEVNHEFDPFVPFEEAIDVAEFTSNDGHEGRIVDIFHTLVDHVHCISQTEDMPDKYKVSGSVQSVIRFVYLIH